MLADLWANLAIQSPGRYRSWLKAVSTFRRSGRVNKPEDRYLTAWHEQGGWMWVPRGLLSHIRSKVPGLRVRDRRLVLPGIDFRWTGRLFDYQRQALATVRANGGGTLIAPSGGGKTEMGLAWAATSRQPTLWLCNSLDLAEQTLDRARRLFQLDDSAYGLVCEGSRQRGTHLTVATIQTLARFPALAREAGRLHGTVIADECFVAGTLVADRNIEDVRAGDLVPSWDGSALRSEHVTHIFRRPAPSVLYRVTTQGASVVCTGNHPFLTRRGWVAARDLKGAVTDGCCDFAGMSVLRQTAPGGIGQAGPSVPEVCQADPRGSEGAESELHALRQGLRGRDEGQGRVLQGDGDRVLLADLPSRTHALHALQGDGGNKSQVRFREDAQAQPHEGRQQSGEDAQYAAKDPSPASAAGREWASPFWTASGPRGGSQLANGSRGAHEDAAWVGLPDLLQTGHCQSEIESRDRSGRRIALFSGATGAGSAERSVPVWTRVDGVEILQPGSDGTFGGLCPDGLVYNLEVSPDHAYVANGFVVHNCHHIPADSFLTVLQHCPGKYRLGLTATPDRSDSLGPVIPALMGPQSEVPVSALIRVGRLTVPNVYIVYTAFAGTPDLGWGKFQASRAENAQRNRLVVSLAAHAARQRRRVLIVADLVEHARRLATLVRKAGIPASAIVGEVSSERRKELLAALRNTPGGVLVATKLADEGLDLPELDCLILASPGKSPLRLRQQVGRVMRVYPGKRGAIVYDMADVGSRSLAKQLQERVHTYRHFGDVDLQPKVFRPQGQVSGVA